MHSAVERSLFFKSPEPLGRFLLVSAIVHAAILAAVLGLSYLQLPPAIDLNQKPIKASLVRLGKARDSQLLPLKEEPPPPPPQKVEESHPELPKEEPKPAVPVPVPIASSKPAATSKQEGEKSDAERRKELFSAFSRTSKNAHPRELEGSAEGSPYGDSSTAEGEQYWGLLSAQVRRNYDVSDTIPEAERTHLTAQVLLLIGRRGQVLRVQLAKSSGNSLFDSAVLSAIKKASPFSPPPDHLRASLEKSGVVLEFRP